MLKKNSRRITCGIGCVWGIPSLSPLSSLAWILRKWRRMWGMEQITSTSVADPGEGPGESRLICRLNWGPKGGQKFTLGGGGGGGGGGRKKFKFGATPPPPPLYLKVWIRHCDLSIERRKFVFPCSRTVGLVLAHSGSKLKSKIADARCWPFRTNLVNSKTNI